MSEINNIVTYLEAIASHKPSAVEELGYSPVLTEADEGDEPSASKEEKISDLQYGIALTMLMLSSMNGISQGSLDVPNQTGLSYLDHSNGGLYHGPQIILVSLCMLANSLITIQQLVAERRGTDSEKIHAKRQAELKRLHTILEEYVKETNQSDKEMEEKFLKAYNRALHLDVQKRILDFRNHIVERPKKILTNVNLVKDLPKINDDIETPKALNAIHKIYADGYASLQEALSALDHLSHIVNDDSEISEDKKTNFNNNLQTFETVFNAIPIEDERNHKSLFLELKTLYDGKEDPNNKKNELLLEPDENGILKFFQKSGQLVFKEQYDKKLVHILETKALREQFINECIYFWFIKEKNKLTNLECEDKFYALDNMDLISFSRSLEINPENGQYIGNSKIYKGTKFAGYALGLINVAVNFGIGIGAFVSFAMIIYALTGVSILALIGGGWPLLLVMLFFALLSMMGPYFITRKYINGFFENAAYNMKLFWDSKNKWQAFIKASWHDKKMFRTLFVTLPTSIGLTIIAVMAFYATMPIMPLALIIGAITFIACVSLFGGMFHESYDRLVHMASKVNTNRLIVPAGMATFIMVMIGLALFLNPITGPFMALAPVSAILLMMVLSIIVFTMSFAIHGQWPMKRSFLASLGLTAAMGQSIAIFCCTAMLISGPIGIAVAALLAIFSFPLFFCYAVMCVALPEDEMIRHCVIKECAKPIKESGFEKVQLEQKESQKQGSNGASLFADLNGNTQRPNDNESDDGYASDDGESTPLLTN